MNRHVTEHSPCVEELRDTLINEWTIQRATRAGTRPIPPAKSPTNHTIFTKAALMCVQRDIDPAKLVTVALMAAAGASYVGPQMLVSPSTIALLNAEVGVDDDGNQHSVITPMEANYRAEWNKVLGLTKNKVPPLHLMDPSYGLRPLVRWVLAVRMKFDPTAVVIAAAAEYKRNKAEADAVFGTDVFRGLR